MFSVASKISVSSVSLSLGVYEIKLFCKAPLKEASVNRKLPHFFSYIQDVSIGFCHTKSLTILHAALWCLHIFVVSWIYM